MGAVAQIGGRKRQVKTSGTSGKGQPENAAEPTSYEFLIPADWSPAKRWWRSCFAVLVFCGVYAAVLYVFSMRWPGFAIGWIPATGLSAMGYYDPLALLELIGEMLTSF